MVTDEERDYMYRVYAHDQQARINLGIRRRLAPLLGNDRRRIELMNALLYSLPGTPIMYYGDELGMGDNFYLGDRNGVRTPMQWSADRNAGFSRANPQRLFLPIISDPEYNYETINVESQRTNRHSLWWFMRRLIALRKQHPAFGRGDITFLSPSNRRVLAFIRHYGDDHLLVVANLSRFVQFVELDLTAFKGWSAVELFGQTEFPPIGELPYLLTLGPHAFYWFGLRPLQEDGAGTPAPTASSAAPVQPLIVRGTWDAVLRGDGLVELQHRLAQFLPGCRWFGGKAMWIRTVLLSEQLPLHSGADLLAVITFLQVEFADGAADTYVVPLGFADGAAAQQIQQATPQAVVTPLRVRGKQGEVDGVLFDAMEDPRVSEALLHHILRRRPLRGNHGQLEPSTTKALRALAEPRDALRPVSVLRIQQSNTSVVFGQKLICKLFRRLQPGLNPELELGAFLTDNTDFANVAPVAGALIYEPTKGEPSSLAILQGFVRNEGDAWTFALGEIDRFLDQAVTHPEIPETPTASLLRLSRGKPPDLAREMLGSQLEWARLLGQRTAELHLALSSNADDPAFAPEPMGALAQRALYQSMRNLRAGTFRLARERLRYLPDAAAQLVREVLTLEPKVMKVLHGLLERRIVCTRMRCHGDFHLGQVLFTGKDFVIIDFEGEPARPLAERRRRQLALQDVAGMLRSFNYAAHTVLAQHVASGGDKATLEGWIRFWHAWVASAYLKAYLERAGAAPFLPRGSGDIDALLKIFLLEKCVYELAYELGNRPDWLHIPARGMFDLVGA
ncbi:MAG: putative maltokinase, partial [bacterium]